MTAQLPDDQIALLRNELARDEGERNKPYTDTANKLTIGIGRNLTDVGLRLNEIDYLWRNDIAATVADLDRVLPWWRGMTPDRQRALINMCFNLGIQRLCGFAKTLDFLKQCDYASAATEMLDSLWARQVGQRAQRLAQMIREG